MPLTQHLVPRIDRQAHAGSRAFGGVFVPNGGGRACDHPSFVRSGSDVLVAAPADSAVVDTVVVADDSATWTAVVPNLRAQRTFGVTVPVAGHLAAGVPVQLAVSPGGNTITSFTVTFALDTDIAPDGSFNRAQFTLQDTDPSVTVSGNRIGFFCPGGSTSGSGRLMLNRDHDVDAVALRRRRASRSAPR